MQKLNQNNRPNYQHFKTLFLTSRRIHRACNDEALRVIKNIPDDWIPGILNGKPVSVQYILPIIFDENISLPDYLYWHLQILSN